MEEEYFDEDCIKMDSEDFSDTNNETPHLKSEDIEHSSDGMQSGDTLQHIETEENDEDHSYNQLNEKIHDSNSIITLDMNVLQKVGEFLAPKDMRKFSNTCKTLQNSLTMDQVIRSAVLSGGYCKQAMDHIYEGCRKKSIWPLSPHNLLDACLVRTCGVCNKGKTNFIREHHNVPICWSCLTGSKVCGSFRKSEGIFVDFPVQCNIVLGHSRINGRT